MYTGSCLCGAIRFELNAELSAVDACHCTQCRKQSGHYFASTDVPKSALKMVHSESLRWYQSSEKVQRGFCVQCGSSLFWNIVASDKIAVAMGAIDGPTGVVLQKHIFVANKGDYYQLTDDVPQHQQ